MANPIVEKIDEIGKLNDEYRKTNDQRIEEIKKGTDARAQELDEKLTKMDKALNDALKAKRDAEASLKTHQDRIELLEAFADRPKGTAKERFENDYQTKFFAALRTGFGDPALTSELKTLMDQGRKEFKDITLGSNIGGGYALPKVIGTDVEKLILRKSDIVANVKNVQVGTSDYQELVSIFGGTSGWVAETGSRSATGTPNLRNCKPTWGELYAYPQISEWSLQDVFFNVQEWLTNDIADGMAVALSTAIYSGNGSSKPTGMTNTAPVATADTASPLRAAAAYQYTTVLGFGQASPVVVTMDAIINLIYSLAPGYRSNAKFAANTATQGFVRRLKTSQGVYLWEPSMQIGQPDRLHGYPVFTWEDLGNANTNDAVAMGFGDFSKAYLLTYRTELLTNTDAVTNPGYVRFYVRRRYGGIPLNNDAVKFLKNSD